MTSSAATSTLTRIVGCCSAARSISAAAAALVTTITSVTPARCKKSSW